MHFFFTKIETGMSASKSSPKIPPTGVRKQSKLGIASFLLGHLAPLTIFLGLLAGMSSLLIDPAEDPSSILVANIAFFLGLALNLLGLGLGVAAAVQKEDKRTLGIVGLLINALVMFALIMLTLLGRGAMTGA